MATSPPKTNSTDASTRIFDNRDRKLAEARERRQLLRQSQRQQPQCQPAVTAKPAIDFPAVRTAVPIADVLQLLGFKAANARSRQQRGPCPLHGSTSGTSRCFSANLDRNLFQCFKCNRAGNVLDLWAAGQHS